MAGRVPLHFLNVDACYYCARDSPASTRPLQYNQFTVRFGSNVEAGIEQTYERVDIIGTGNSTDGYRGSLGINDREFMNIITIKLCHDVIRGTSTNSRTPQILEKQIFRSRRIKSALHLQGCTAIASHGHFIS